MKESWKPYPMFCPNCGRLNYGYKSEDNRIKYECVQFRNILQEYKDDVCIADFTCYKKEKQEGEGK